MHHSSDDLEALEAAIRAHAEKRFVLKLYVAGSSARSARAIRNVRTICDEHLSGRYDLEVIDVLQQPELAMAHQLVAAPTLIKEQPEPTRRLVGDMTDAGRVLTGLNIVERHDREP
jgi:circadian clock protein KaiB